MSNFLFSTDEESMGKINIDDLFTKSQQRDQKQLSIFNKMDGILSSQFSSYICIPNKEIVSFYYTNNEKNDFEFNFRARFSFWSERTGER